MIARACMHNHALCSSRAHLVLVGCAEGVPLVLRDHGECGGNGLPHDLAADRQDQPSTRSPDLRASLLEPSSCWSNSPTPPMAELRYCLLCSQQVGESFPLGQSWIVSFPTSEHNLSVQDPSSLSLCRWQVYFIHDAQTDRTLRNVPFHKLPSDSSRLVQTTPPWSLLQSKVDPAQRPAAATSSSSKDCDPASPILHYPRQLL